MSSGEAASKLGLDDSQVRRLAAALGVGFKVGRNWLFTTEDMKALRERPRMGRPKGS
jgi:hypothetical protein